MLLRKFSASVVKALRSIFVILILITGCSKKDNNPPPPPPPPPPEVKINRIFIDSNESKLLSTDLELANGIFIYDKLAGLNELKTGDLLIEPRNFGYLRKIQTITNLNGSVTINTSQGTISEFFPDSPVRHIIIIPDSLNPFQTFSTDVHQKIAVQKATGQNGLSIVQPLIIPDFTVELPSNKGKIKFKNMSFSFDPKFVTAFDIAKKNLEIGFENATTESKWTVTYTGDLASGEDFVFDPVDMTKYIPSNLRSFPFAFPGPGGFPILGKAEFGFQIRSKLSGKVKFDADYEYHKINNTDAYLKMENGVANWLFNYNNSVDEGKLKLNTIGELAATVEFVPLFKIYLFQVPVINIGFGVSGEAKVEYGLATGLWNSEVALGGFIEGDMKGTVFGKFTDSKISKELIKSTVYEAPKILSQVGSAQETAHINEVLKSPIVFQVLDTRKDPQWPVRVFFTSNYGKWENDYVDNVGITGIVSNKFTMGDNNSEHILTASIKNANGDIISKQNIYISVANNENTLLNVSGNSQVGLVGKLLSKQLRVKVTDDLNKSVPGINLLWSTTDGTVNGVLKTDINGEGTAGWTLGNIAGLQTLTVKATDVNGKEIKGSPVTFNATAIQPTYVLSLTSGDRQTGQINKLLPNLLSVKVIDDKNNPSSGINLLWSTSNGTVNGALKTDINGKGTASWTLGNIAGLQTLTVKATDVNGTEIKGSPVTFNATAIQPTYVLSLTSGDHQTGQINKPLPNLLSVKVTDDKNNPGSGINLLWSTSNGTVNGALKTDINGIGTASWILGNIPGPQMLSVKATETTGKEIAGSPITFNATGSPIDTFRYKTTFTIDGYGSRPFELDLSLRFENGTITGIAYGSNMIGGGAVTGSTDGTSMTINIDYDNHLEPKQLNCDGISGDGCPNCTSGQYHEIRKWSIKGTTDVNHSSLNSTYTQEITNTQMIAYPSNDGTCEVKPLTQTTNVTGTLFY